MATRTLYADNGKDRLVISTICNHLIFFHEAGFAVANTVSRGGFKSSCVFFGANVSGTDDPSITGGGDGGFIDLGNDARSVNDVLVRFEYDGEAKRVRHVN